MNNLYVRSQVLLAVTLILISRPIAAQNFHLVKDINTARNSNTGGTDSAKIGNLTPLKDKVIFMANSGYGHTNFDLWSSDGTVAGTQIIKDTVVPNRFSPSAGRNNITAAGDNAYFFYRVNNSVILYKTDATSAGTTAIDTFNAATETVGEIGGTDSLYYFTVTKTVNNQQVTDVWRTNGTNANTFSIGSNPTYTQNMGYAGKNGKLFYFGVINGNQTELWVTNGTQLGTTKISASVGFSPGFAYNGKLIFGGSGGLYSADSTAAGVKTIGSQLSYIGNFTVSKGMLFFIAHDDTGPLYDPGFGLYQTDGTFAGTKLVKRVSPYSLTDVNGVLYFFATEYKTPYTSEYGLWKSDGTPAGTTLVKTVLNTNSTKSMVAFNGRAYFIVYDNDSSRSNVVWESDGTDAGTHKVNDAGLTGVAAFNYYNQNRLIVAGNKLFFTGANNAYGNELWAADAGTTLAINLLNFAGSLTGRDAVLHWTAVSNSLNQGFEVQRSIDGIHFSAITEIERTNAFLNNEYTYTDNNVNRLHVQKVHYRLLLRDINGIGSLSKIVTLDLGKTNIEITVAPNPVTQSLRIVSAISLSDATIKIINLEGRVLITKRQNMAANGAVNINVSSLSKGSYVVAITSAAINYNFKIIKD